MDVVLSVVEQAFSKSSDLTLHDLIRHFCESNCRIPTDRRQTIFPFWLHASLNQTCDFFTAEHIRIVINMFSINIYMQYRCWTFMMISRITSNVETFVIVIAVEHVDQYMIFRFITSHWWADH